MDYFPAKYNGAKSKTRVSVSGGVDFGIGSVEIDECGRISVSVKIKKGPFFIKVKASSESD